MKTILKNYSKAVTGPFALLFHGKKSSSIFFFTVLFLIIFLGYYKGFSDSLLVMLFFYWLFSLSFTYYSLSNQEQFSKVLYNAAMAFLSTSLFTFGAYAMIELLGLYISELSRSVFLYTIFIIINFIVLILTTDKNN